MKELKLKFQNGLKQLKDEKQLVKQFVDQLKIQLEGVDINTVKYNSQLVVDVCLCLEKYCTQFKDVAIAKKLNKKMIVLCVFQELYKDIEIEKIDDAIEFAHQNGMLKLKLWRRLLKYFF